LNVISKLLYNSYLACNQYKTGKGKKKVEKEKYKKQHKKPSTLGNCVCVVLPSLFKL
jgi:hypothetical protein